MRQVELHRVAMLCSPFSMRDKPAADALESAENEGWPTHGESVDARSFPDQAVAFRRDGDGARNRMALNAR
ncbi:MAG TPA: hypothetical protein VFF96_02785 [Pseudoxanthomonas sp.]|nr:hypothetical protein [Pseudoxanthomonas sp.]